MSCNLKSTSPLPHELWVCIFSLSGVVHNRLPSALELGQEGDFLHVEAEKLELKRWKAALSLRLVCRLWNAIIAQILYRDICVGTEARWPSLSSGLKQPSIAGLVRSIRLSTSRFDRNVLVLSQCTNVEVLIHPEFPHSQRMYAIWETLLPELPLLKRVYWRMSWSSSTLLRDIVSAAKNLEYATFSASDAYNYGLNDRPSSSPLSTSTQPTMALRSLELMHSGELFARTMLSTNVSRLTHLTLDTAHLALAPRVLPALRVLKLSVNDKHEPAHLTVSFPVILALCGHTLRELVYDARCAVAPPAPGQEARALHCVRLLSPDAMQAANQNANAQVLLGPAFSALISILLDGPGWRDPNEQEWPEWAQLRKRGCQVEAGNAY